MREIQRMRQESKIRLRFPPPGRDPAPEAGSVLVLAGKVGTYKTTLAWNMALNLSLQGLNVCWVGLEQPPGEMAELALSRLSQVPTRKIRTGNLNLEDAAAIERAVSRFEDVCPVLHVGSRSLESIASTINRIRYDVVFIDYLQLIDAPGSEYEKDLRSSASTSHA